MDYAWILLLAVIQGIAEFLPISSSGHLVIVEGLLDEFAGLKIPDPLELNIVLHVGTLCSILVIYFRRILRIFGPDRALIGKLIVGTLPAVLVGLTIHEVPALKRLIEKPLLVGCMLQLNGLMLILSSRTARGTTDENHMTYRQAFIIGLCQAVAILPGTSRSGATIAGGLFVGLKRESAATFSFLLAIIAICGAAVLEGKDLLTQPMTEGTGALLLGAIVAFAVGVVSLKLLLKVLNGGHFAWFACWTIPVGLATIAWQLSR